jgi:nickel-dependent lactate racemase
MRQASHEALHVPLGAGEVEVPVPPGWEARLAVPPEATAVTSLEESIRSALERPVSGPRLVEIATRAVARAASAGRIALATIVVTDATRDCPDDRFLPPLLSELRAAGIAAADITILVATGLHRASTDVEKRQMLGAAVVDAYRVLDHDATDPAGIADLGTVGTDIPAFVSRHAVEADVLVATGVVEPHQYAGFSGGGKTVAIGAAGEATISFTHGVGMLDRPGVRLAQIAGNPFQDAVRELARRIGLDFVINLLADADGRPIAVAAGSPEATHDHLVGLGRAVFTVPIPAQVDVAVAGVGAPKDANLYQATRAVSYLHFAPIPVVRRGGVYLLPATIPEGAGDGVGEGRFFAALRDAESPAALIERLRSGGSRAGEQRAYIVARVLVEARIIVVGAERPDVVRAVGLDAAETMEEGIARAVELASASRPGSAVGPPTLLVVPHAIRTLPIVEAGWSDGAGGAGGAGGSGGSGGERPSG